MTAACQADDRSWAQFASPHTLPAAAGAVNYPSSHVLRPFNPKLRRPQVQKPHYLSFSFAHGNRIAAKKCLLQGTLSGEQFSVFVGHFEQMAYAVTESL